MTDVQPEKAAAPEKPDKASAQKPAAAAEAVRQEGASTGPAVPLERRSWGNMAEGTRKAAAVVNQRAKVAGEYSASQIRSKPIRAVAVALGAGMVLGALLFG